MTHNHNPDNPTHNLNNTLALAQRGLNKNKLLHILTTQWELSTEDRDNTNITNYFLLYWETKYFKDSLKDGCIFDSEDNNYCVIWYGCKPHQIATSYEVIISFRRSSLGNFALVAPVTV